MTGEYNCPTWKVQQLVGHSDDHIVFKHLSEVIWIDLAQGCRPHCDVYNLYSFIINQRNVLNYWDMKDVELIILTLFQHN
jgi:hypothetical protein